MKLIDIGNPSNFPNIVMQILDKNCDVIRTKFENDRKFDELKRDGGDAEILCAQKSDQNSEYDFFFKHLLIYYYKNKECLCECGIILVCLSVRSKKF